MVSSGIGMSVKFEYRYESIQYPCIIIGINHINVSVLVKYPVSLQTFWSSCGISVCIGMELHPNIRFCMGMKVSISISISD